MSCLCIAQHLQTRYQFNEISPMSWCLTTSVLRLLLAQQEMQSQRLFITQYQMEDMATSSSVHGLLP